MLKQGFDAAVEREAGGAFKTGMATLNKGYTGALDRSLATATQGGKLDEVLALKEEKEHIEKGLGVPSEKEESTQPAGKVPDALKALRKTYRSSAAQHEATKSTAMLPLYEKYDQALAAVQTQLTKSSKLEEALRVKTLRDRLATERGLAAPASTPTLTASTPAMPPSPAASSAPASGSKAAGREEPATKDKPFINSLGMKFVPVKDTDVLFCIHETRYKDYAAYAAEAKDVDPNWKDQSVKGFTVTERADEHPVNKVSWTQVKTFCAWLSAKEGKNYRLAKDREWSIAVGIGREEKWEADTTPGTVNKVPGEFPWGQEWPPPRRFGNYADESLKEKKLLESDFRIIEDYDDGFPTTAPVMSFKPNKFGLHDLSGNVWEWVEDWGDDKKKSRVYRGGCWNTGISSYLHSSDRLATGEYYRSDILGFRVVLELPASAAGKGS